MIAFRALAIAALAVALNITVAAQVSHASSNNGYFNINSYDWYCTAGSSTCSAANLTSGGDSYCSNGESTCPGLNYAAVEAAGTTNGATWGTPGLLTLSCINYLPDGSYNAGFASVSTTAFYNEWNPTGSTSVDLYNYSDGPWYEGDPSMISGKATLLTAQSVGYNPSTNPPGSETLTQSTSSINASEYSYYWGTIGSVTGTQSTDNMADTPTNGGFRITIRGVARGGYTGLYNSVAGYYTGTITCQAGGPNATTLGVAENAGPPENGYYGAEGELDYYPLTEFNNNCGFNTDAYYDPAVYPGGCGTP